MNPALARRRVFQLVLAALAFAVLVLSAPDAKAQSLDQFRSSGHIGERYDGYCVARSNNAAARSLVDSVNAKRQQIYAQRAREQGIGVGQVGSVYAQQIIGKAPAGTYFQRQDGKWTRK